MKGDGGGIDKIKDGNVGEVESKGLACELSIRVRDFGGDNCQVVLSKNAASASSIIMRVRIVVMAVMWVFMIL